MPPEHQALPPRAEEAGLHAAHRLDFEALAQGVHDEGGLRGKRLLRGPHRRDDARVVGTRWDHHRGVQLLVSGLGQADLLGLPECGLVHFPLHGLSLALVQGAELRPARRGEAANPARGWMLQAIGRYVNGE